MTCWSSACRVTSAPWSEGNTRMNICLINDSFPPVIDGVANVVMNYAQILESGAALSGSPSGENRQDPLARLTEARLAAARARKDRVLVATPRYPGTDYTGYPYPVVSYQSMDTTKAASGYRAGNPLDMKAIHDMAAFNPDLIHVHSPASAAIMARVLRYMTGAPIIYTYHTKYDIDIARAVKGELLQKEAIRAIVENISACDEVWAVSRGAGENLRSLGYEGEIRVMNNGVDFPKGRADEEAVRAATADYDLPEGVPLYLFVGRLMNYKGLPLILDALKMLDHEGRDFRMVFIGGGGDAESLQKEVREAGLSRKIFFTGPIRDREILRAWNTRADLFLFPSTFDTNGLVVREAAACGLASLLIRNSCAAEGITDGENGFLAEENAASIAAVLRTAGTDLSCLRAVGNRAMEEIYLSWEDCVREARRRYEEVLVRKENDLLPVRQPDAADHFLRVAANAAENASDGIEQRARFMEGMMENITSFRENAQALASGTKEKAGSLAGDAKAAAEAFLADLREMKEEFARRTERIQSGVRTVTGDVKSDIREISSDLADEFKEIGEDLRNSFRG